MPEDTTAVDSTENEPTTTGDEPKKVKKTTEGLSKVGAAKVLGLDKSDVAAYNQASQVVVTHSGGKYQVSRNGKAVRHLQGPRLTRLADDVAYTDARVRGPFVGTAAQVNAAAHEGLTEKEALEQKAQRLASELAETREALKHAED
jgi:hypothetical protein